MLTCGLLVLCQVCLSRISEDSAYYLLTPDFILSEAGMVNSCVP